MSNYNYIQTFYIDPQAVNNSPVVMLSSVELYFKTKPNLAYNTSGSAAPGVSIWLCTTTGDEPNAGVDGMIKRSIVRVPYQNINAIDNASVSTIFKFADPIQCESGKTYGVVVAFEDAAYDLWVNTNGENIVEATGVTTAISTGTTSLFRGQLYKSMDSTTSGAASLVSGYTANPDKDLKFKINVSRFKIPESKNVTIDVVNKNYEFITMSSTGSFFKGGELVYQNSNAQTGSISLGFNLNSTGVRDDYLTIRGSGTTFTNHTINQHVICTTATGSRIAAVITSILNDTLMTASLDPGSSRIGQDETISSVSYSVPPVAKVYYSDYIANKLILVDSTADSGAFRFTNGSTITGVISGATCVIQSLDKQSVDTFLPIFGLGNPSFSDLEAKYTFALPDLVSGSYMNSTPYKLNLGSKNDISTYDAYVYSRSLEVQATSGQFAMGDNKKSMVANVTFTYETSENYVYHAPYISEKDLDMFVYEYDVSNTTNYMITKTDGAGNTYLYDTEVDKNGLAQSKYISKRISFATNRYAEDIRVYVTAYRPKDTDIKLYAKLHNGLDGEPYDDKSWTPLEIKTNIDRYSVSTDDYVEYEFGLPQFPETIRTLPGSIVTQYGNNLIATSSDYSAVVKTNDVVLIQDSLLPVNHDVFVVSSSNSTVITLNRPISNNNLISTDNGGSAFGYMTLSTLKYPTTAFNNILNDNVARYTSSSLVQYDKFNSMQIKATLLANKTYVVPKIDSIQAIGVSA